ncbi:MAG: alpha/beta hydrolase [Pseudomonadota bacterium]
MADQLTFHEAFPETWFEQQYNLRAHDPDYQDRILANWTSRSHDARARLRGTPSIRYGKGERQTLDFFPCTSPDAPTLIYFHGGYWQRGDKSIYSFLAEPFVEGGSHVVIAGYDLCPSVTVTEITRQARDAIAFVWRNAAELGVDRHRISVIGHSAGGHIAQMMMGTDWIAYDPHLPADFLTCGIPISPLSYLEPVRRTTSLNAAIRMTPQEAEEQSPMIANPPNTAAPQLVAVGGEETSEFLRQARLYVDAFTDGTRTIALHIVPDVDHLGIINRLADQDSTFHHRVRAMIFAPLEASHQSL